MIVTYAPRVIIVRRPVLMLSLLSVKRVSTAQLDNMSQDQKHIDAQKAITAQLEHMKKLHALLEPTCHISMEHSVTTVQEVTIVLKELKLQRFAQLVDTALHQLVLSSV